MALMKVPVVRQRKNPSGAIVYYLDYMIDGQRFRETIGPRKDLAEKRAAKIFTDLQNAQAGQKPLQEAPTLQAMVDRFLQTKVRRTRESSQLRYKIYAEHFLAFFRESFPKVLRIDQVTRGQLEEHIQAQVEEGFANKTLNGQMQFLRSLFNMAVDDEMLAKSPANKLKAYPEQSDETPPYWTEAEVLRILAKVGHYWRDIFAFLYHTGLRKEELIHLTWDDVDLVTNPPCIIIRGKKDWRTKTNRTRVVPLSQDAVDIVNRQKRQPHNRVFSDYHGTAIHRDKIYIALKTALKKLELTGDVHQWRHTFATHLVKKGVGIEKVSKLLGHASIEMTMRYAHVAPMDLKIAVDTLPRIPKKT